MKGIVVKVQQFMNSCVPRDISFTTHQRRFTKNHFLGFSNISFKAYQILFKVIQVAHLSGCRKPNFGL